MFNREKTFVAILMDIRNQSTQSIYLNQLLLDDLALFHHVIDNKQSQ